MYAVAVDSGSGLGVKGSESGVRISEGGLQRFAGICIYMYIHK